jgi:RNA polymerase sigma-70 factor (ECF subfamily)
LCGLDKTGIVSESAQFAPENSSYELGTFVQEKSIMPDIGNQNQVSVKAYSPNPMEARRLAAARRGNSHEFSELTEPYRRELLVHCYRILGSLHDAEDMVQETMLRAWKRIDSYEERASFRAWLYKIATNVCLDTLDKRRRRVKRLLPKDLFSPADPHKPIAPPETEMLWLELLPDEWLADSSAVNPETRYSMHESISLAFLTALQILPARQRAVLILKDVMDWPANEIADLLETTTSSVNSALHRARTTLAKNYHGKKTRVFTANDADEQTQKLLEKYMHAWQSADVNGLVALLKKDATLSMPPSPSWYAGRESIGIFAANTVFAKEGMMFPGAAAGRWKLLPVRANGQAGAAVYQRMENDEYHPFGVHVLSCEKGGISQITCFIDPSLPTRFGLPDILKTG